MAVLVERQEPPGGAVARAPGAGTVPLDLGAPVRDARRVRPIDRTRPPGRPKRMTVPRVVAAPRLPRPRPLPMVWLLLLGAAVCTVVYGLGWLANSTAQGSVPDRTVSVLVAPGQSLWSIAQQHAPASDPGAIVDRIQELNDLDSSGLVPVGTPLIVPDGR